MKALVVDEAKTLSVKKIPLPQIGPNDALVKVHFTGVCGSDLYHLSGENPRSVLPLVAGHEISGEIVQIGRESDLLKTGTLVTAFPALSCGKCPACLSGNFQMHRPLRMIGVQAPGGFAEFLSVPIENLIAVPEGVSKERAALAEPLSVAVHGVALSGASPGDTALVLGAGPIGLMAGLMLKDVGCTNVVISERNARRVEFARQLGFDCIDPEHTDPVAYVMDLTSGSGAHIMLECAGHASTIPVMIGAGALYARIVIIGTFYGGGAMVDLFQMSKKELSIFASWQYSMKDFRRALTFLESSEDEVDRLTTHLLKPEEIERGTDMMRSGEALKVLIEFGA